MSSSSCNSKAAARRGLKATSNSPSPPGPDGPSVPDPSACDDSSSPDLGSLSVELVDNSECLMNYNGDIKDGLINLLDHIEDDDRVPAEEKTKTVELMHAVFHFVQVCAENNDSETEMRDTLKSVEVTFDDVVSKRERGSPYQKVINWCVMQRSKKEKQQRQQKRRERAASS